VRDITQETKHYVCVFCVNTSLILLVLTSREWTSNFKKGYIRKKSKHWNNIQSQLTNKSLNSKNGCMESQYSKKF